MKHGEDALQIAVANFLRLQYPRLLWIHVPNGGRRNAIEGARFKQMGVLPGVADILIFAPGKMAAIELKYGKNKMQSTQVDFMNRWVECGGLFAECRSVDEVQAKLKEWKI